MSILESSSTSYGLCLCVGDYHTELVIRLLDGYEEDRPPLAFGPITCFGMYSPKDRHREYVVRLVKHADVFKRVAMPVVKAHIIGHGAKKPVIVVCVDPEDELRAYTGASEWLDLIAGEVENMIKSDEKLAANFSTSEGSSSMLGHLGITVAMLVQARTIPDRKFILALRRLSRNREISALLIYQVMDPMSDINLNRLREIMTGGDIDLTENILSPPAQLFIQPARDEAIDTELGPNVAPEVTLAAKPPVAGDSSMVSGPIEVPDVKIGLEACLFQIWEQARRNGN